MNESQKYAIAYIVFSIPLNFVAKDLLSFAGPFFLTAIRSATMAIFLIILLKKIPKIEPFHMIMALLIYSSTVLWLFSLEFLTPGDSIVLGYSMPVIAVLLGRFLLGEKERIWIALFSLSGFALYAIPLSSGSSIVGSIVSFTNAFFWALYSVLYRKRLKADPVETNAAIFLLMTAISIPFIFLDSLPSSTIFRPRYILELFWFTIAGGAFQFISWNKLILLEGIEKATLESYLVPIGVLTLQFLIYEIKPVPLQIFGLGIALIGVFLPNFFEAIRREK